MSNIAGLSKKFEQLKKIPIQIANTAGIGIKAQILSEFSGSRDAYGRPWAPLKSGGSSNLIRSGSLFNSVDVQTDGIKINISIDWRVVFHQVGTKHMPARPVLSIGVVPPVWSQLIEDAFKKCLASSL